MLANPARPENHSPHCLADVGEIIAISHHTRIYPSDGKSDQIWIIG